MNIKPLLNLIAKHESRGDYNAIVWLVKPENYPPKKLTKMTVREVLAWQHRIDKKQNSEAAGRYQIMEDTLRELAGNSAVLDAKFNKETQDALAIKLLNRRGLQKFLTGEMSLARFGNGIAKEWASMPLLVSERGRARGQGYHSGQRAGTTPDKLGAAIAALLSKPKPRRRNWFAGLFAAFRGW